ncbi:MAG: folylpolyglutamate synthase/dihydrofolate synthase family protein [Pseudomonadota bacterium]|nr:folylpolyglutamate synthase/dihydrofolate synthase family protein [Pseudomonadota bacterium]
MIQHPILAGLSQAGMRMGLPRMRSFMAWLGNPHVAYPTIHVGGTNGKGSVCRMVGAMLEAQGFKVGITTSPHIQAVNERIRIGSTPISDERFDDLMQRVDAARREWAAKELPPEEAFPLTYFEFLIAAAFLHFAEERVDVAIIEVGMGGRLDATNVVSPIVSAIVTVGLDHTQHLGPDHASIAGEKAGILKPGVPAVLGPLPHDAMAVIRSVAVERGAPLSIFGEDYRASGDPGSFDYRGGGHVREGLRLGIVGDHQVVNAAVALRIVDLLPPALAVGEPAVRAGLLAARNRGRLEWLAPDLLVDGAHNPDGATVLANYLSRLPRDRKRTLLLGAGTDKDVRGVAWALAPQVDRVYTTACAHPMARSPGDVAAQLEGLPVPVSPAGPLEEALPLAQADGGLVIVAGSLYLVGAVRDLAGIR